MTFRRAKHGDSEMELQSESLPAGKTLEVLPQDCWLAALNWIDWADNFTCPRDRELPVLSEETRFKEFCIDYSLLRGETMDWEEFRHELQCLNSGPKENAEALAGWLKEKTGCRNRHFSLVTKLNAFRCPERFIASDTLNRRGLHRLCGRRPKDYAEQLRWCRDLAADLCRSGFVKDCLGRYRPFGSDRHAPFAMRVVDCALMRVGR